MTNESNMKRKTRSILEELSSLGQTRNRELLIENRGISLIESSFNLLSLIRQHFNEEEAQELERRFLNAVRTGDSKKFTRGVSKVIEARKIAKNNPQQK